VKRDMEEGREVGDETRGKGEEEEEEEGQNGASSYSSSSPHTRRTSLIAHRHTDRIRRQLHTDTRTASDAAAVTSCMSCVMRMLCPILLTCRCWMRYSMCCDEV